MIVDNYGSCGGGLRSCSAEPWIADCLITGNTAHIYGAMDLTSSVATIVNCTITHNLSTDASGAILVYLESTAAFSNCVVWGNAWPQIDVNDATAEVAYTDIQGGWSGVGNFSLNPRFVDELGRNYRLAADSPCVDAGDPAFVPQPGETDLDGRLRVWDGNGDGVACVDMGAYEFGSFRYGDLNCDRAFDAADIEWFFFALSDPAGYGAALPGCSAALADMNGDGALDGADIQAFCEVLMG